jgi:hypothetical protein
MTYRVHEFRIKMTQDRDRLEQFLNNLTGKVVAIIPNVNVRIIGFPTVDFLLIVEEVA